jgi:hypothetical protein
MASAKKSSEGMRHPRRWQASIWNNFPAQNG